MRVWVRMCMHVQTDFFKKNSLQGYELDKLFGKLQDIFQFNKRKTPLRSKTISQWGLLF